MIGLRNLNIKQVSLLVTLVLNSILLCAQTSSDTYFCNAPLWWQTAINLPDDPFKTLVSKEGELLYDYNGAYYKGVTHGFKSTIGVSLGNNVKWLEQKLDNPVEPIVVTSQVAPGLSILQEAFASAVPAARTTVKNSVSLIRFDKGRYDQNWNDTRKTNKPEWTGTAAINEEGSVHFQFAAEIQFDLPIKIAMGFYENTGDRELIIKLEGGKSHTINPFKDYGLKTACIYTFEAWDHNRDGKIDFNISSSGTNEFKQTYLNAFWYFQTGVKVEDSELLRNKNLSDAISFNNCATPPQEFSLIRDDFILTKVRNTTDKEKVITPKIIIKSMFDVDFDLSKGKIRMDQNVVTSTLEMIDQKQIVPGKWIISLKSVRIKPGSEAEFAVKNNVNNYTVQEIKEVKKGVSEYWLNDSNIPFSKVTIPDPYIQNLISSSIRNIWQAREIRKGLPVFQVGPTIYRNLWIVDGAFLLETASILGADEEARNGVKYVLNQQKESGAFEVLSPKYYKENGIVIWTAIRHAMLSQDKEWLEDNWKSIEGAFNYIQVLRERASKNEADSWFGINEPGEIDGGLSGHGTGFKYGEYSNAYWNLIGMKAAIQAANWLDKKEQALEWQEKYDSFYQRVRKTMARDILKDEGGNSYLPIFMENATNAAPQKGQWSFCHAVYPGQVFEKTDPFVQGNMAMLERTEQEGMVVGTGWDHDGIWNYFASFYGHAWLWQGDGVKAAKSLYAMANHASPTLVWREEHNTSDNAYAFVGDMPHNWASAEFIRLAVHMLAIDRGNELHLFEGLPKEWVEPGMETSLKQIATPFGELTLDLQVDKDGKSATLKLDRLADASCKNIIVHLKHWASSDNSVITLNPKESHTLKIPIVN